MKENKETIKKGNQTSSIDSVIKKLKEQEAEDFMLEIPLGDEDED